MKRSSSVYAIFALMTTPCLNGLQKARSVDDVVYPERAFLAAARTGDIETVKSLITNVSINCTNRLQQTALHSAAIQGHTALVQYLIDQGASLEQKDQDGLTALCWTAIAGYFGCLRALCSHGAQVDIQDPLGYGPLHFAAQSGHAQCVKELIQYKAALDQVTKDTQETPLHLACTHGHKNSARALLQGRPHNTDEDVTVQRKAFIEAQTKDKQFTPLHCAAQAGHFALIDTLISHGAQIDARTADGKTALHLATEKDTQDYQLTVSSLLRNGADPSLEDTEGNTARDCAELKKRLRLLTLFPQREIKEKTSTLARATKKLKRNFQALTTPSKKRKK